MTNSRGTEPLLLLGVAALILAVGGWMMTVQGTIEGADAAPEAALEEELPEEETAPSMAEVDGDGPGRTAQPAAEPIPVEITLPGPLAIGEPAAPAPSWFVRVLTSSAVPPNTRVELRPLLDEFGVASVDPVAAPLEEDGSALVDIGPLLASLRRSAGGAPARRLEVRLLGAQLSDRWIEKRLPDPLPEAIEDPGRAFEVTVEPRVVARIRGTLLLPDGSAPREAHVLVYGDDGGTPRKDSVAWDGANVGVFDLLVEGEGTHHVAALTDGHVPITLAVTLTPGITEDLGELTFDRGASISGMVRGLVGGEAPATVNLMLKGASQVHGLPFMLSYPAGALGWDGARFAWFSWSAKTDGDGAFEIHGLVPLPHVVNASAGAWRPFGRPDELIVTPPARVDLGTGTSRLDLSFRAEYSPPTVDGVVTYAPIRGTVIVTTLGIAQREQVLDGARLAAGEATGQLSIDLPAATDVRIHARYDGFESELLELRTGAEGTAVSETIQLVQAAEDGGVIFTFTGDPPQDGTRFSYRRTVDGELRSEGSLTVEEGRLRLGGVTPGPTRFELVPGDDRFAPTGHLVPIDVQVDVPVGSDRVVQVDAVIGGTLVLSVRDGDGNLVQGSVEVKDEDGNKLESIFVASLPNGRVAGHDMVFDSAPARRAGDLPPGTYSVRYRGKDAPPPRTFEIVAGRTTEVLIELP